MVSTDHLWGDSSVVLLLDLSCACGASARFEMQDAAQQFLVMQALDAGWRIDAAAERCICPKCGPKKFPELYKNVSISDRPRKVRRLGLSKGKQDKEKVRKPRRVRGR